MRYDLICSDNLSVEFFAGAFDSHDKAIEHFNKHTSQNASAKIKCIRAVNENGDTVMVARY